MPTLLLRLEGPMQSWGTRSRFPNRDTELEPSKSGVIGLICAALGRPRTESVSDLAALRLGVRVDNPGSVRRDYQTAEQPRKGKGERDRGPSILSDRFYLADASFTVGLEANQQELTEVEAALARPVWHVSLGRKAYVPSQPLVIGTVPSDLERALSEAPLSDQGRRHLKRIEPDRNLRVVIDANDGGTSVRTDVPISFAERTFARRSVLVGFVEAPA